MAPPTNPTPVRRLLPGALRAALVAAGLALLTVWLWDVAMNSEQCEAGWGLDCLGIGLMFLIAGPVVLFLVGWLALRVAGVRRGALVTGCTLLSGNALVDVLNLPLVSLLPGWLAGTLLVAGLAAFWAWALTPGRDLRPALVGLGVTAAVWIGSAWLTRGELAADERADVEATGVQPYVLNTHDWELVSAREVYARPELELIYDHASTGDRVVLTVTELPSAFDPEAHCAAAYPDESQSMQVTCSRLASTDDVWKVLQGLAVKYLARVGDSRVVVDPHQGVTDAQVRDLIAALDEVSVG